MANGNPPTPPHKPITTRRELESHIVAQAWRDPAYRELLLKDPKEVLQEELKKIDPNIQLPAGLHVSVHEETPTHMHIVLPRNPRDISISEAAGGDLEAIAPQTIAILVLAAVAVNTVAAANNVGTVNAAVNTNVGVNVNVAATTNTTG
ncbi:MAG TPA: NHLP leader peptide family RiPP precursor [Thermoanaerobaculia bacterium]|jgi:hypothetical protein|nr:NHLP leader peptide family RiPP precursor [Thermoanaerobaculia bacterium]